jgi:hypothetical protein
MIYNNVREFADIIADYTVTEFRRYGATLAGSQTPDREPIVPG